MQIILPFSFKKKMNKFLRFFSFYFQVSHLSWPDPHSTMIDCLCALIICQGQIQLKILLNIQKINYPQTEINLEEKMAQMFREE